jgi:hypothetical protein
MIVLNNSNHIPTPGVQNRKVSRPTLLLLSHLLGPFYSEEARMKFEPLQPCPQCNEIVEVREILCTEGPHFSQVRCPGCDHFFGFRDKPKNDPKLEKRPNGCPTPKDLGINYCQVCLRPKEKVKREYLCTHHQDDDPTNNVRENLQVVCIACHKLIAWTRAYFTDSNGGVL